MTLAEIFAKARSDGFTMACDEYSYHGRKIGNWNKEISDDHHYYIYMRDEKMATAQQVGQFKSNEYTFW